MTKDYPDDENGNALRQMEANGINVTLPRVMDFEHCFPGEVKAKAFKDHAQDLVPETRLYEPDPDRGCDEWQVQCRIRLIPTHQAITDIESRLAAVAYAHNGYPDGWGSLSNPDGTPSE